MTTFPLLLALVALSQAAPEPVLEAPPEVGAPAPAEAVWPVYLGASLSSFINVHGGVAAVRVSVEPSIFRRPWNEFTVVVELGAGVGYLLNTEGLYTEHYNYSAIAGFAYRSDHHTWEWGFRLGLGADYYRTTIDRGQPYPHFQQRVVGYIEGRAQLGLVFGPHVRAGVFVGYGSPFVYDINYAGSWVLGGFQPGLYVSFR